MGKLYDDSGNLMSPSFSTKNGVRYRFYVSSALLHGRKAYVGSVGRLPASEIETTVIAALRTHRLREREVSIDTIDLIQKIERIVVSTHQLLITPSGAGDDADVNRAIPEIRVPWSTKAMGLAVSLESDGETEGAHNEGLVQSVIRAQVWMQSLRDGMYESIEKLAEVNRLHPKVVRQALRLAFLSPDVTSVVLEGKQPAALSLARIPKLLPLPWTEHRRLLADVWGSNVMGLPQKGATRRN